MSQRFQKTGWEPVPGFPGYERNELGEHRSWRRMGDRSKRQGPRLLVIGVSQRGYRYVKLWSAGKGTTVRIARAVLEYHVGPCPEGMEACHNDGNKQNDTPENLRWATHPENEADKAAHGTKQAGDQHYARREPERLARGAAHGRYTKPERNPRGSRHGMSVLTEEQAIAALQRVANGESRSAVARDLGVSFSTVSLLAGGKTWKHLPRPSALERKSA